MFKSINFLPFAWLLLLIGFSCKDKLETIPQGAMVEATFAGRIVDEFNSPINRTKVEVAGEVTFTDRNGVFLIKAKVAEDHAVLKVSQDSFFVFSRVYQVNDQSKQWITIQLLNNANYTYLNSDTECTLQVPGGAFVKIPAGTVANEDGSPFSGQATLSAQWLNPEDHGKLSLSMPGNLNAINVSGELTQLLSYGVIGINLRTFNLEDLNVQNGKPIEIHYPISPSAVATAPDEISLWYYNSEDGYWIEDGTAQKIGNEYVGYVSRISWWNIGTAQSKTSIKGKVFFNNAQNPAQGVNIVISPSAPGMGAVCGVSQADVSGAFNLAIPQNVPLTIRIEQWNSSCTEVIQLYVADIGSFSGEKTLSDIVINDPGISSLLFKGRITDCNNLPLANGYIRVNLEGYPFLTLFTNHEGVFSYTQTFCGAIPSNGSWVAYDIESQKESIVGNLDFSSGSIDFGDITACEAYNEYIEYKVDLFSKILIPKPQGGMRLDTTSINTYNHEYFAGLVGMNFISIHFSNNGLTNGTNPLSRLKVNNWEADIAQSNLSATITTTALQQGELTTGTFGGTFVDLNGGNHTISGSYRVKRDW